MRIDMLVNMTLFQIHNETANVTEYGYSIHEKVNIDNSYNI